MRFYRLNEVPIRSDAQVFKASPVGPGIAFIVVSLIFVTALVLGIYHVDGVTVPRFFFWVFAAFAGLFWWMIFHSFRASLKPSNWLMRCDQNGVIIQFRSYLNWRFPSDDVKAVGFDYSEIAWAGTVKEWRASSGLGGDQTQRQRQTFVNLCLAHVDTVALEKQLAAEINLSPEGIMIARDYPVQLKPGGILELRWRGIRPSARAAIQFLSQQVKIVEADAHPVDLKLPRNFPPEAEDTRILELARSGDEIGAISLTRQLYGCSLSEAKDFVKKLHSRPV